MAVQALCDHIEAANEEAHLSNPTLLQELVGKLPADQKLMWAGYRRGAAQVDLKTFSNYMADVVRDASSVVLFDSDVGLTASRSKSRTRGYINSHTADGMESFEEHGEHKAYECLFCGREGHRLRECNGFKNLSVNDRWRKVRSLGLCQNCLFGHGRRSCRTAARCNIEGCPYRHHPLLHSSKQTVTAVPTDNAEHHAHRSLGSGVLFRVIPVTIYGKSGSVDVFAFLDEGSQLTLIEEKLAK